ncbi:hypothetical protein [Pseudoflavonifractor phocaeensis]|uniref:hypothetical protein n=1 Tax=Pseudoflavonifractor phocaeensis TaxID=1870988 RepID=UPI00210A7479|nr:hypothetical protein [Pseudoflavonifractor phocaeensis]MCQ4863599.1 hypothetical protein [Pseudoflavonifractor phocaeensis]
MDKKGWLWSILSIVCFAVSYALCRFAFFGSIHSMKQWPNILAIVGLVILSVSLLFKKRATAVMTIIGYMGGFALGAIFNSDGVDQGGGTTNNLWIIWTVAFLICVVVGVIVDVVAKKRTHHTN